MIEEVKKELEEHTKRNLVINSVPVPVIKAFKNYCQSECGDVYAVGLYQLLKTKAQYEAITPLLSQLIKELNELKTKNNEKKTERRTFADE